MTIVKINPDACADCGHESADHPEGVCFADAGGNYCPCNSWQGPAVDAVDAPRESVPAENPKDAIGSGKLPLHLWPESASALGCLGMLDGALKYGRANFRHAPVLASIYYDAARRHLDAWFEGEDDDPDSGLPHIAHALACVAIVVDADVAGKLIDDRNTPTDWRGLVDRLTPHVARLKALHEDRSPRHYTIKDKER